MKRIPITVQSNYLGRGKTMLMNQLLKNRSGKKYAVIEAELDHCLLTEGEMASDWMSLHDTLPGNGIVTFT